MILRIVSPEKVIYKGEVQMVKLPGIYIDSGRNYL